MPEPTGALSPEALAELVRAQVRLLGSLLASPIWTGPWAPLCSITPKAQLLEPMPRIGETPWQIVGEVGPILVRALDVDHACAEVGATPVTKGSGKGRAINFRWAVTPGPATRVVQGSNRWETPMHRQRGRYRALSERSIAAALEIPRISGTGSSVSSSSASSLVVAETEA